MVGGFALLKAKMMVFAYGTLPVLLTNSKDYSTDAFKEMAKPATGLLNSILSPLLGLVGAAGAIYCVILGAKYAKAEEPQDREKAKKALQNAIVGFVLIFILLAALKVGLPALETWYKGIG